jgi:hypothetical protein
VKARKPAKASDEEAQRAAEQQARFVAFRNSPEYRAAVAAEEEGRDMAFLDLPEFVCGVELRPVTMLDLCVFYHLRLPFMASGFLDGSRKPICALPTDDVPEDFAQRHIWIPLAEIARFLWIQSKAFTPKEGSSWRQWRAERRRKAFVRRFCRPLKYGEACDEIRRFLSETLTDRPKGNGGRSKSPTSWIASEVSFLCKQYHWNEREVMTMPVRRLFQYERRVLADAGKTAALGNNSDRMVADWLKKQNARN